MFSYSPATRGFYDGKSGMVPTDAVEVSADRHAALISAQAAGAEIVPGPDGAPVELWRPAPTEAELLAARRAATFLTDVQMLIGLVAEKWITEEEGAAWRDGTLPPQVVALIGTLPEDQQFGVSVRALRGRRIDRLDPLVVGLAASQGRSPADLDAFFQTYSQL